MVIQETVKNKVLEFRAKNKMTQEKFAEKCDISRQSVMSIESKENHRVKPMTLWKINHYFNTFKPVKK